MTLFDNVILQDLDEEAGYDDYYSGDEDEYEDEEEEDEEPPKEELEFLESRQKLKESIRKKMGNGSANAQSSQERRRKLPYNEYVVAKSHFLIHYNVLECVLMLSLLIFLNAALVLSLVLHGLLFPQGLYKKANPCLKTSYVKCRIRAKLYVHLIFVTLCIFII